MLPASKMTEKYCSPAEAAMLVLCPSACSMIGSLEPAEKRFLPPERGMRTTINTSRATWSSRPFAC